eukprot:m.243626 g.243626  ORF g.243626 m.243626 type:complete len:388 (+) comp19456_c0_seq3:254-1417(+)
MLFTLFWMRSALVLSVGVGTFSEVVCPPGKLPDLINATAHCLPCSSGTYVPRGSQGYCSSYQCASGTIDHDSRADTPCVRCGPGSYTLEGSFGSCYNFQCALGSTDHDSNSATPCQVCLPGSFGSRGSFGQCTDCAVGSSDTDADPATACTECPPGTYAPGGTWVPCSSLACEAGTVDNDFSAATLCTPCSSGNYVPAGQSGSCSDFQCPQGAYDHDENAATPCVVEVECNEQTSSVLVPYSRELGEYLASTAAETALNASNTTFETTPSARNSPSSSSSSDDTSLIALVCTAVGSFALGTCFGGLATARYDRATTQTSQRSVAMGEDAPAPAPHSLFHHELEVFRNRPAGQHEHSLYQRDDTQPQVPNSMDGYIYVTNQIVDDVMY